MSHHLVAISGTQIFLCQHQFSDMVVSTWEHLLHPQMKLLSPENGAGQALVHTSLLSMK